MYEINIKANSVGELVGRIRALAAEFGAFGGVAVPAPVDAPPTPTAAVPLAVSTPTVEGEVPYADVRNAFLRLATLKGRDVVGEVLKAHGATKTAQELEPSSYAAVLTDIEQRLAAG